MYIIKNRLSGEKKKEKEIEKDHSDPDVEKQRFKKMSLPPQPIFHHYFLYLNLRLESNCQITLLLYIPIALKI